MKKPICPPQNTPFLDVQEKITGFEWATGLLNRLLFNRAWYMFFNNLGSIASQTMIVSLTTVPLGPPSGGAIFAYDPAYFHTYYWDGTSWSFADGGSEYIVRGAPTGGLWAPCDGGTYQFAQNDGSLASKASEDLRAGAGAEPLFPVSGASVGSRTAATSPTYTAASPKTDGESATHTHSVNIADGGSVTVAAGVGTTFQAGLAQIINTGTESAGHTHALGSDAAINPPSVAKGGLPLYKVNAYFQRR